MLRKSLLVLMMLSVGMLLVFSGCGGDKTGEQPTVEKPEPPTEPPVEPPDEPEVPPEDTVTRITEDDFKIAYFDFDKYNLRPDAREALEYNARLLRENPNIFVLLEGHCDERGTVEYNLALGEKRAQSAKDYLVGLGISGNRLETISYGKEKPVALAHNEAAWAKNRRVEFTITQR